MGQQNCLLNDAFCVSYTCRRIKKFYYKFLIVFMYHYLISQLSGIVTVNLNFHQGEIKNLLVNFIC